MNKLVLRLSVGILVVVVVSFIGAQAVMRYHAETFLGGQMPAEERMAGEALRRYIATLPPQQRESEVVDLAREVGAPTEPIDLSDARIPGEARAGLDRAGLSVMRHGKFGSMIWVLFPDSQRVLKVGPLGAHLRPPAWAVAVMFLVLLLIVALAATLLSRPLIKRVRELQAVAKRIARGELAARVQVRESDGAIGVFAANFNQMADRNQAMLERQRDLLRAVAHELRTPAARIRFELELAQEATEPEERERHVAKIDADLDEMDALIRELLLLDRLESGSAPDDLDPGETIAVLGAVRDEIERAREARPDVDVATMLQGVQGLSLAGSERLFRRAVRNVVTNALRHAHGRVQVSLVEADGTLRLRVDDDGAGIPPGDRNRVLEPFARLDPSRSRESGGLGLGLTIVDRIVNTLGGRLVIDDGRLGGASVEMSWPTDRRE